MRQYRDLLESFGRTKELIDLVVPHDNVKEPVDEGKV